ncbi:MAG: phytase [Saprospiraceae bacterium]|nr:phytase [Saprospiraceae bacterium]
MFKAFKILLLSLSLFFFYTCYQTNPNALKPDFVTEQTLIDTDDPAIWVNPNDPMQSLILGTDKGDENGGVYIFDLKGKLQKSITGLKRPNNIDVEYGLMMPDSQRMDIAVYTERGINKIRVLKLPEMEYIDNGGIEVFEGVTEREPMGIGLYKKANTGEVFAIVGRKIGPDGAYLWQYRLNVDSTNIVKGEAVRKFGAFKGTKEIESIAVDDALGYVYYSDEGAGVRKYYADPDSSNSELALFASKDFTEDHEGISIYTTSERTGYILVSDQQSNRFHVFTRESPHQRVAIIPVSTNESDGSEVTNIAFGNLYPKGFFIAMSDDRTFQIYKWEQLEALILQKAKQ